MASPDTRCEMDDWEPVQDVPAIAWTLSDPEQGFFFFLVLIVGR